MASKQQQSINRMASNISKRIAKPASASDRGVISKKASVPQPFPKKKAQ